MSKVAVILANGFEDFEAIVIADILRRADIHCDLVGLDSLEVVASHKTKVIADKILNDEIVDYDMIVLPGGLPGSTNLRDSDYLIEIIKKMNEANKYICAICAAPMVLEKANLLNDKYFTAYGNSFNKEKYLDQLVVIDNNIITSRGPATSLEFAYTLVDVLGKDSSVLKEKMLYNYLLKQKSTECE